MTKLINIQGIVAFPDCFFTHNIEHKFLNWGQYVFWISRQMDLSLTLFSLPSDFVRINKRPLINRCMAMPIQKGNKA